MEDHGAAVRSLFDDKARNWRAKYNANGPLARRLEQFAAALNASERPHEVLDFGCGTGDIAAHLSALGYAVRGCDVSPAMIAQARAAFPDIEWTAVDGNLPYATASFDAVVASSVLEYVAQPSRIVGQLARVIRPDGVLIFTIPDIRHRVRRAEALAARVLRGTSGFARVMPRIANYLRYLEASKNRLSVAEWRALVAEQGFAAILDPLPAPAPLLLLRFRKT